MDEQEIKRIQEEHERFKSDWHSKTDDERLEHLQRAGIFDENGDVAPRYRDKI